MKKQKIKSGRPPFERKIKVISPGVYTDQLPIEARDIRTAIDFYRWAEKSNPAALAQFREAQKQGQ